MSLSSSDTFQNLAERAAGLRVSGVRGRYAPSPTGPLHLGNLRTALLAWLQVRLAGGTFIMRMEDLDQPRVRPGSAGEMLRDLDWLGLDWDEGPDVGGTLGPYDQSQRSGLYAQALDRLKQAGLVFPCFCSRKDITQAASAPHLEGRAPVYPGTCRQRSVPENGTDPLPINGRKASWRYRAPTGTIRFEDRITGPYSQDLQQEVGDFVLRRSDGLFAYQLAVVVDDALMGVTDVVRGVDLLDSTPRQLELFRALGFPPPRFWHMPLIFDANGRRLAKRDGSESVASFRKRGYRAEALIGRMAVSLGFLPEGLELSARDLLARLDPYSFKTQLAAISEA